MKNLLESATYQKLNDQLRNAESLFRTAMNNRAKTNDEKALELAKTQSEECRKLRESINKLLSE